MPKLPRVTAKVFASNAAVDDIGQYGSALTGTKVNTGDIATIQALPAYEEGWRAAVISNRNYPTLQEMNGLQKTFSQQIAYTLQTGIPEWDENTTYYANTSFCQVDGVVYQSLTDDNLGNNPTTATTHWVEWGNNGDKANTSLTNLTPEGEKHFLGERNISNCIKSAPELCKWDLADGIITLKAGSIVRWASGKKAPTLNIGDIYNDLPIVDISWDGTNLIYYTQTQQDYSWTYNNYTGYVQMFLNKPVEAGLTLWGLQTDSISSGTTAPTVVNSIFYNTDENSISHIGYPGENQSFPILEVYLQSGVGVTSAVDVYNTGGKMGSSIWLNKNVTVNLMDGVDDKCGLANEEYTTPFDYFINFESDFNRINAIIVFSKEEPSNNLFLTSISEYDSRYNIITTSRALTNGIQSKSVYVGQNLTIVNGNIQSYTPLMPFRAANAQEIDGRYIQYNRSLISGASLATAKTLTLDLSKDLPADGQLYEVLVNVAFQTDATAGHTVNFYVSSNTTSNTLVTRARTSVANIPVNAGGNAKIPVGATRQIVLLNSGTGTAIGLSAQLTGARRIH